VAGRAAGSTRRVAERPGQKLGLRPGGPGSLADSAHPLVACVPACTSCLAHECRELFRQDDSADRNNDWRYQPGWHGRGGGVVSLTLWELLELEGPRFFVSARPLLGKNYGIELRLGPGLESGRCGCHFPTSAPASTEEAHVSARPLFLLKRLLQIVSSCRSALASMLWPVWFTFGAYRGRGPPRRGHTGKPFTKTSFCGPAWWRGYISPCCFRCAASASQRRGRTPVLQQRAGKRGGRLKSS